ncbi:hypothetical protein GCM10027299_34600 [Larkinella ripae]
MIDTITIMQEFNSSIAVKECIKTLQRSYSLDRIYRTTSNNTKIPKELYSCWDNGFKIWIVRNQLFLQGSLTKLFFGDNSQNLNKVSLIKVYDKLMSKYEFVDWSKAYHKRIDLGVNIQLSHSPTLITNSIIGGKRMKRAVYRSNGDTVNIGNKSNLITFYNKSASLVRDFFGTHKDIPENLLRIEYRMMSSYPLKKHFGRKDITVQHVLTNLDSLPKIWYEMYSKVDKTYTAGIGLFSTKKEMEMKAIIEYGVKEMENNLFESYKANMIKKSTKQNIRKYLSEILDYQKQNAKPLDLIKELDNKVERFVKNNDFILQ